MIHVNLLPPAFRPIKRTPLPHLLSLLVLCAAIAAMAFLFLQVRAQMSATERKLAETEASIQSLRAIIADYEELKKQEVQLRAKVTVIEEILDNRIIWSEWIHRLLELMPDNIWLERVWVSMTETKQEQIVRNEKGEIEIDPRTKREKTEVVTTREFRLNVHGYAKEDDLGNKDVNPFITNTKSDPEFSSIFHHRQARVADTTFNGRPVREFTLQYSIDPGGLKQDEANLATVDTEEPAK